MNQRPYDYLTDGCIAIESNSVTFLFADGSLLVHKFMGEPHRIMGMKRDHKRPVLAFWTEQRTEVENEFVSKTARFAIHPAGKAVKVESGDVIGIDLSKEGSSDLTAYAVLRHRPGVATVIVEAGTVDT